MESLLNQINSLIWGFPVLVMILTLGIILTVRTKAAQISLLPAAWSQFLRNFKENSSERMGITGYRALCTALAATVGTGNLAGVAGAISIGGPGAVFWIWISGFLGMITKCAEVTLSLHFREKNHYGEYVGGPMYMIKNGLPNQFRFLSYLYSYFGIVAALGIGNAVQVNAVSDGIKNITTALNSEYSGKHALLTGIILAVLMFPILMNGATGIAKTAEKLIPCASLLYVLLACTVLVLRAEVLPSVCASIIEGAFSPKGVTGGAIGSMFIALRVGISRGVFTNEAGMGTASIAHAASEVKQPLKQGFMGIMEVFLDTLVICTLTALVILCSGIEIPFGTDTGLQLTLDAFANVLGDWCRILLTLLTCIFAVATVLGWGLYGARCCQFLFGDSAWKKFILAQTAAILMGAVLHTSVVWAFSEVVNGLMAIPNLIAVYCLQDYFIAKIKEYRSKEKAYRP